MLKPSVKHYKGPKMLVYLQANKFHGCSRETRDSWIRDKEQFSTPRRETIHRFCLILSPASKVWHEGGFMFLVLRFAPTGATCPSLWNDENDIRIKIAA